MNCEKRPINIFQYTDHKLLIRDLYNFHKQENPYFSYRVACRCLGFKSSAMFHLLIEGKCKASEKSIERLAALFKMNPQEKHYFRLIVHYNQAKNVFEKKGCLEEMHTYYRSFPNEICCIKPAYSDSDKDAEIASFIVELSESSLVEAREEMKRCCKKIQDIAKKNCGSVREYQFDFQDFRA